MKYIREHLSVKIFLSNIVIILIGVTFGIEITVIIHVESYFLVTWNTTNN